MINKDNLAIMFIPNTGESDCGQVMQALNIHKQTMNDRYLGMLVHVGDAGQRCLHI
jgi:hypothetical protein